MAKNCYKRIISVSGELFLNTFPNETCYKCIGDDIMECAKIECPLENISRWRGFRKTSKGSLALCSNYGKNKGFVADFDIISSSLKTLCTTQDEIMRYREEDSVKRIRRVLHNVRTINAHSLMEMRGIVPESFFKQHMKEALIVASEYIVSNSSRTAHGILEIAKDLYSIKTEFSVYDKLIKGNETISKKLFFIRDVLMTVVYPFFGDFTNKNVVVDIQTYHESVRFDFETIQIAFYHIIENTAKYVKPQTRVKIFFPIKDGLQKVVFDMTSLHINKEEICTIFNEGYSGVHAIKSNQNGEGIGLYRSKRLVEMNGGTLTVEAGDDIIEYKDIKYSRNRFIFALPIE